MKIEKDLPFDHCENCPKFIVDTDEQVIFADGGYRTRILKVGCKNAWLCMQLKDFLKEENNAANTDAK